MNRLVRHLGTVEKIDHHSVFVRIEQQSACSTCHAKAVCMAADKKEKIIEVFDDSGLYSPNEQVEVIMSSSMGMQAVVIAFAIPLVLVLLAVFLGVHFSGDEAIGGLIGLAILLPYYVILYGLRDKLKKKFIFTLNKLQSDY